MSEQKISSDRVPERPGVHFEEFKLYLESAERTTDRRLDLNKSNASLSLLIVAGIGAISSWAFGKQEVEPYAVFIVGAISFLAAVFCRWWWRQVVSYKDLNSAKFEVLNGMAPRIVFPDDGDGACESEQPFAKEWEILQAKESLGRYRNGFALGSSLSELTVPVAFFVTFVGTFLVSTVIAVLGRYDQIVLKSLGLI